MRRLSDTIARLKAAEPAFSLIDADPYSGKLEQLIDLDANPGALRGYLYVPERAGPLPLVVVLHGCTQTAAGYDRGSGWSKLAERHGFAVLFPEQQRANNQNLCFNWFSPADVRRGAGEAESIRCMVATMVERHPIDEDRIFVTGLSAGGAMTSVLLACYPEVFAGGAVIAGLPFAAANTLPQALERMRGQGHPDARRYADLIRETSGHEGPWPKVSIWHGDADAVVVPANADASLGQWLSLQGLLSTPSQTDRVDGAVRRRRRDVSGEVRVTDCRIAGMAHGTPLATQGPNACGTPMPHMIDVGTSSTWHIAKDWGILDPAIAVRTSPASPTDEPSSTRPPTGISPLGIQATIEEALRSAGLMK